VLDLLLRRGLRYSACATDDAHFNPARQDSRRGWVQVKTDSLEPESLLAALKRGDYYSSTGPEILDIEVNGSESVTVSCSPAARVFLTGHGSFSHAVYGDGITSAEFSLKQLSPGEYYRITVRAADGTRAWSNPIWP